MRIFYTRKALSDLDAVFAHISDVIGMRQTAVDTVNRIRGGIADLKTLPKRHKIWQSEPWKCRGLRYFSVGSYFVFYRVDDTADTIYVERVIYSRRDIDRLL